MIRAISAIVACVAIVSFLSPAVAQVKPTSATAAAETTGTIEAVTVYRGQAMVTRVIDVEAPAGGRELVVGNLPSQIIPDSLFATADNASQIRAVRYRARAVQEEPREEVRKLDQQIDDTQKAIRKIQSGQALLREKQTYLTNLERFTSDQAKQDIAKGTLNAETVKAVTTFIFEQRTTLADTQLAQTEELQASQDKLTLLQRQRQEVASRYGRTAREAVVFLDKQVAGKATVRLNYLVQGAGWSPAYNLRSTGPGKDGGRDVTLEYNALVQQMSGEDWAGVKVTLSTATPNMMADAPILTPLWVTLGRGEVGFGSGISTSKGREEAGQNLKEALDERRHATTQPARQMDFEYRANEWANRLQIGDLIAGKDALLAGRDPSGDGALSVNYVLPGSLSIPSRSDQQMIQIASLALQAKFYYQAAPVLTPYVYQQAEIVNTSDIALLSGIVNAYMDGQFMGTGRLPMVAKGQQFTVGLGVDSQLRVTRELADKTDKIQGGNRELTFKYRIVIDNYKDKPAKVRVLDRLPDPKTPDIRVILGDTSDKLSEDPVYLRTLRKTGILWWEIDVPAKSAGPTAKIITYDYKIEFDRNMSLAEPTPAEMEKDKAEFEEHLKSMNYKK